jgi:hypothetical protein
MRKLMVLLAVLATATTAAAQPLTQKLGKEAAKGAAKGVAEQGIDLGKNSREVVGGVVDSLVSRRAKVEMLANDVGREVVRGAVTAGAGAVSKACGDNENCLRTEAHNLGFALGQGVSQGISAKLSIVPSVLGFALGFVFAALLAGLVYLLMSHRRREEPVQPLVPRTSH